MSDEITIKYEAEPTVARFHASNAFVRGIMGPIGSGKSVGCVMEMLTRSMQQPAHKGKRRTRWAAVRNTYPELKITTIKTFDEWMPKEICTINWAPPITAWVIFPLDDGTTVEMEVIFVALDKPSDVKKLLSLELTGMWLNEAREIPKQILDGGTGRVGRFPPKFSGKAGWSGIIMDTNPPDDDHWWYKLAEEARPHNYEFFRQPPALIKTDGGAYIPNPKAENVRNQSLGYEYWLRQIPGKSIDWINVYIMGTYGTIQEGRPVYPEYNDLIHCPPELLKDPPEPQRGLPLYLGWDYGLTPACVAAQITRHGQLVVLDEWVAEDMDVREFARDVVRPAILNDYVGMPLMSVGDPGGKQRAQTEQKTCQEILAEEGLGTKPAPTNELFSRTDSVKYFLTKTDREGNPGFLLSPKCSTLRKGFNGGYKYERLQVIGEDMYKDQPKKNRYSHPHDALQYLALEIRGVQNKGRVRPRPVKTRKAAGWT